MAGFRGFQLFGRRVFGLGVFGLGVFGLRARRKSEQRDLLLQYLLSRLSVIETGGILGVRVSGLMDYLELEWEHPGELQKRIYSRFGPWALDADKLLTGDTYAE